ncbi:class I SAM-dependent methyltransferase [Xanthomonas campestris pv. raphani]|uniref:class I SAM-dependent methyltransferase n=1 Tax=Xanthomonas campestris TaxID=339 RepID=UPI002B235821|nr:class I SAM-dependent methyltransferase [Xanthomonas campestris]MEA9884257.1 class I SAM-dependent methyltransferase [Xanthomonas campestris pv. raphani]MEB2181598.1 class I SAM-dependent methyltransferase [Xanthomonas campestris pv. campestris]
MNSMDSRTLIPTEPTVLVFPVNLDASAAWIAVARSLGQRVLGASSEPTEDGLFGVEAIVYLPYITDPTFVPALRRVVAAHGITHLVSAHQGVWAHLEQVLHAWGPAPAPSLCSPSPHQAERASFARSRRWADATIDDPLPWQLPDTPVPAAALTVHEAAGLHRQFVRTPGQCDEEKLRALCALARVAPRGDIVEIGCLYGRSALALGSLGQRYAVGSTLCVDAWGFAQARDQGDAAAILNGNGVVVDFEHIFDNFLAAASQMPGVGCIHLPSQEAIEVYRQAAACGWLDSGPLRPVPVQGAIAVLHIDGNHAYAEVVADIAAWLPWLRPGGWLLLDDYVWAFGDGPRRAGDSLMEGGRFDCAFVAADTLFLRKRAA